MEKNDILEHISKGRTDFCWVTPIDAESKLRPVAVKNLNIDFAEYEVSSELFQHCIKIPG